uniref:Sulfatase n=1 Tax=Rubrivivax gelatinosus S1 TaxID=1138313 RepID=L8BA08_RUBGE
MQRLVVLICTHDRAELLARALASLDRADVPPGWSVEVLVVANACRDGTAALLEGRTAAGAPGLPLAWFAEPVPGKSNALNSALSRIDADLVGFVDDDQRVDPGYLQALCNAADAHPEADMFCGLLVPDWDGREPAWVHDDGPYRIYPLPVPRFDPGGSARELDTTQTIPGGGNLAVRASWFPRVGPFSTALGPTGHDLGGSEDIDWLLRAVGLGARLRYVPEMRQYHHVDHERLRLRYLMRKAFRRTESTVGHLAGPAVKGVPRHVYRKTAVYALKAVTALSGARRRFYLVRTAAALGEWSGYRARRGSAASPEG